MTQVTGLIQKVNLDGYEYAIQYYNGQLRAVHKRYPADGVDQNRGKIAALDLKCFEVHRVILKLHQQESKE